MAVDLPVIPLAGVLIDFVSEVAGMVIVLTGLLAGMLRARAVLGRFSPERTEWLTAAGFLAGVLVSGVFFALDIGLG
jgi:hypothetical protein